MIDLQAKLLPAIFESDRVIRNCQLLSSLAQLLRLPTVLTTQYAKGLGSIVPEISSCLPGVQPFDKTNFGCFGDQEFQPYLRKLAPHANTLMIAGIETHICVTQTVLGAIEAGYLVHVAADATSSRTAENWHIGLKRMERAGAVISSTEMMVYELLGRSDTPEFKAILPLIK
jgi:hypothetical protein